MTKLLPKNPKNLHYAPMSLALCSSLSTGASCMRAPVMSMVVYINRRT